MRHALPQGDLDAIVGRALDLLIEQLMKRRFAATSRVQEQASPQETSDAPTTPAAPSSEQPRAAHDDPPRAAPLEPVTTAAPPSKNHHIPSDVRRAVFERDGGRCTWRGPDGVRCDCHAWLEYDHIIPRAMGGRDDVDNLRLLCRAHNRLAAEQAYGQATIDRIVERQHRYRSASSEPPSRAQRG